MASYCGVEFRTPVPYEQLTIMEGGLVLVWGATCAGRRVGPVHLHGVHGLG